MTGRLAVVGLGPGDPRQVTPEAAAELEMATDLVGYATCLARVPARPGQCRHGSANRVRLERARLALALAASRAASAAARASTAPVSATTAALSAVLAPTWASSAASRAVSAAVRAVSAAVELPAASATF